MGYWITEPHFAHAGFEYNAHFLIVTRAPDGGIITAPEIDPEIATQGEVEELSNGMIRIPNGGSQGFDTVLQSQIRPYLYVQAKSGVRCASINMSAQPRSFMVRCFLRRADWMIYASGPDGAVTEIARSLLRVAHRLEQNPK